MRLNGIETARLTLSPWTEAERAPFVAMCADPEVMHDYPAPDDVAAANARFDTHARGGVFAAWRPDVVHVHYARGYGLLV